MFSVVELHDVARDDGLESRRGVGEVGEGMLLPRSRHGKPHSPAAVTPNGAPS